MTGQQQRTPRTPRTQFATQLLPGPSPAPANPPPAASAPPARRLRTNQLSFPATGAVAGAVFGGGGRGAGSGHRRRARGSTPPDVDDGGGRRGAADTAGAGGARLPTRVCAQLPAPTRAPAD
ncbi:hypothetical protein CHLRE_12g512202v5 [Chlamydomonas reinhardtii]|uniref:Uncharacterized protein n=1 Tax=Chlamydomonas reinhardtii TaxID=3055 RepID=A0A2K3D2H7_CHLRE|nr:uncharacterized protein CHLRE_12g512202v5 [Chlamydomonas reinhardtii]PNW74738.1 hypothetical protein CHLRE_12g512202v5 [Chlamydomonas reinhardtii]